MRVQGKLAARSWRAGFAGLLTLLAAGCSDTDDGGPAGGGAAGLGGVAAVGVPIVGGTITAKCSGGQTFSAASNGSGRYDIELPASALPCALQVSGGKVRGVDNTLSFHAFASRLGTANLTPLTDLAVALASGMTPSAWFDALTASNPPSLANLTPAITTLLGKLRGAGYTVPNGLDPVTTAFTAAATNAYDQLLEALSDALGAASSSYAELLVTVVEDGAAFEPPVPEDEPGGETPPGTVPGTVSAALAGTYTLTYFQSAAGAPFTDMQEVPVIIGTDNTLKIDGKTLTNPYFRKFGGQPHLPEIIWFDAARKLEYALTDNQENHFNEINVGDTTGANAQGIPRFLGQLRMPAVAVTLPTALNGSYTPRIISKGSDFNSYTIGNNLPVTIASDRIDIDSGKFVFQPGDDGYEVTNNTNSTVEPNYRVSRKTSADNTLTLTLYVNGDHAVAFKLESTKKISDGVFSNSSLYAEPRPLPANVLAFFDLAVSRTPAVLTVVQDDLAYNSGYPAKCATLRLSTFKNGSGDGVSFTYFLHKGAEFTEYVDQEIYAASNTRYLENSGNKILQFSRNRISLRADGFVDVTAVLGNSDKDRATNDPAQVAANCPP